MKLRTFRGVSMAEALAEVKRHFGPGAVILNTRTLTRGGLLGVGARPVVEITAAPRMEDLPDDLRPSSVTLNPRRLGLTDDVPTTLSQEASAERTSLSPASPAELLGEVKSLKSAVGELLHEARRARAPQWPGGLHDVYQQLVRNAVAEEIAREMLELVRKDYTESQLADGGLVRARLAEMIKPMIPAAGEIHPIEGAGRPYLVALVGPTGVGKTTTIAKLAAHFRLQRKACVGLITIDTYRIAAVEQLKTYARIIDVPLEVASTGGQLKDATDRMAACDLILVDTAGRSQRDTSCIQQLRELLGSIQPDEIHLVLSSTASQNVLNESLERFSSLGVNRLLFTKLDEAIGFGVILNCLQRIDARLSYLTTGQDVPNDIEVGCCESLAKMILTSKVESE